MTSNKTKQIDADKKLTDHVTSFTKVKNDFAKKFGLTLTKSLTKNIIIGYKILSVKDTLLIMDLKFI